MNQPVTPTQVAVLFNNHTLPSSEFEKAKVLNFAQEIYLNQIRIDTATEILNLTYEPDKDSQYFVRLAYLQGQLHILDYLIDQSQLASQPQLQLENEGDIL